MSHALTTLATRTRAARARLALLVSALLAGVLVLTSACVTSEAEQAKTAAEPERVPLDSLGELTLNVGDQKGGTQSLLQAAGELDDLPYTIEWSTFTSGPPQVEALTAGQIDFAVTGNTPPIFGASSGARIKIVSATNMAGKGDQILSKSDSPITKIADLKGKKVAVGKGTSAHGNLLLQLSEAGLGIDDIEPIYLQPAEASAAFGRGDVDAWAIWDPYTALTETTEDVRVLATAESVSNGAEFGLASLDALADPQRNTALADLVQRVARASQWAAANPDEWAEKYSQAVDVPLEPAKISQRRRQDRQAVPADALNGSEQSIADAFSDAGLIEPFTFADFVDTRYSGDLEPYFAQK